MTVLTELIVPLIMLCTALCALHGGAELFPALTRGALKGLETVRDMLPALVVLFPAVYMLRASGVLEAFASLISPLVSLLGIPPETVPLALIRPISGGAATAAASELIKSCGADSLAGRTAAVMLGSSETTFYVIAVYFSAAKIKNSRWAIPAALCADFAVFLSSAIVCRLMWG